jgi:hypothetical protein
MRFLSVPTEHRRFMPAFAMMIGIAALLATALHGIEAATDWLLGALPDTKSAMLYSLSAITARITPDSGRSRTK